MDDRVPAWFAYSGVIVVGGTAALVLAWYQHLLGIRAGMPPVLSWTFSIGLDWGSAVSGVFWFFTADPTLRRWARGFSVLLIAASTGMTCVSWGLLAGWRWAALGAIHPLVFFGMAKLLTLWQAVRARLRDQAAAEEARRLEREQEQARRENRERERRAVKAKPPQRPVVAPVPGPVRHLSPALSTSARVREWLRAELAAGRAPTGAQADEAFGLSGSARVGARELRRVQQEQTTQEATG
jgi:hypothetical protein